MTVYNHKPPLIPAAKTTASSSFLPPLLSTRQRRRQFSTDNPLISAPSSPYQLMPGGTMSSSLIFPPRTAPPPPRTITASHASAASAASTVAVAGGGMSLVQFFLVFTLGGLFFSTALAYTGAIFAFGKDNLKRLFQFAGVVTKDIWTVYTVGLQEAMAVLRMDGQWKWRDGWKRLKQEMANTRRAVRQGFQAFQMEANLVSAAVGKPGLIPLQYFLDRFQPYIVAFLFQKSIRDAMKNLRNDNIKKLTLQEFAIGEAHPQLMAGRSFELGPDTIALDIDVVWDSDLEMKINLYTKNIGVRIPITVDNVSFKGAVRIIMTPLVNDPPGYGALLVSFPELPKINLVLKAAGAKITKVPWLKRELSKEIQKALKADWLWPRRQVIPTIAEGRQLLTNKQLRELKDTDPLLEAEQRMADDKPMIKNYVDKVARPDAEGLSDSLQVAVDQEEEGNIVNQELENEPYNLDVSTTTRHDDDNKKKKKKNCIQKLADLPFLKKDKS